MLSFLGPLMGTGHISVTEATASTVFVGAHMFLLVALYHFSDNILTSAYAMVTIHCNIAEHLPTQIMILGGFFIWSAQTPILFETMQSSATFRLIPSGVRPCSGWKDSHFLVVKSIIPWI